MGVFIIWKKGKIYQMDPSLAAWVLVKLSTDPDLRIWAWRNKHLKAKPS